MTISTLRAIAIAALIGLSLAAATADAQGFPGGGRGQGRGGNRGSGDANSMNNAKRNAGDTVVNEPAIALERELASLRSDLLLDSTQVEMWTAFERSVRDAARAAHFRQSRAAELRQTASAGGIDVPPGAAASALQDLIEEERTRADLLAGVVNALGAMVKVLDQRQAGMINRRIVQALHDPLGAS